MSKSTEISCLHSRIDNDLFYLQLHITDKCNLRCKHCYEEHCIEDNDELLNQNEVFDILDQFQSFLSLHRVKGKIYFGIKQSRKKIAGTKNIAGSIRRFDEWPPTVSGHLKSNKIQQTTI